ncbi:SMC-Scp complex subunit ScpB [Patescibacteria group bacterium]
MLKAKIESILFVSSRPMSLAKLVQACGAKKGEVAEAVEALAAEYAEREAGIRLLRHGESVQMATAESVAEFVREFLKDETTGEMTRPSLETLTIVAYRGPLTKAELEQVRGVNCSLILRNLMMRGLVEALGEHGNPLTKYQVTMDFLRFLGVSSVEELPDYSKLRAHANVERVLKEGDSAASDEAGERESGKAGEGSGKQPAEKQKVEA